MNRGNAVRVAERVAGRIDASHDDRMHAVVDEDADGLPAHQHVVDDVDGRIPCAIDIHFDMIETTSRQGHPFGQRARIGAEVPRDIGGDIRPPIREDWRAG